MDGIAIVNILAALFKLLLLLLLYNDYDPLLKTSLISFMIAYLTLHRKGWFPLSFTQPVMENIEEDDL